MYVGNNVRSSYSCGLVAVVVIMTTLVVIITLMLSLSCLLISIYTSRLGALSSLRDVQ